ncbi:MAG TPA: nicotinamide riboside transporter PnuC [Methanocorpusculum sp.]|nr:nicotinamide riboside transporter PnuC [Methanocorpusculum sp.]
MHVPDSLTKLRELVVHEISGWKKWELVWLIISIFAIAVSSIFTIAISSIITGDAALGIVSAITGIISAILTGKGKPSSYLFGAIYTTTYVILTFRAAYYSSCIFELLFILPLEFVGLYLWIKHMNAETHEVHKRQMTIRTWILTACGIIVASILLGLLMTVTNDPLPFVDSFTTVTMAVAMFLSVMRYAEQWVIWIIVNALSLVLWIKNFLATGENGAVLMLWIIYLINSVIMCIRWYKEAGKQHSA